MGTCKRCGTSIAGSRTCPYCDNAYCSDHRLPEHHDCGGVQLLDKRGKWFDPES